MAGGRNDYWEIYWYLERDTCIDLRSPRSIKQNICEQNKNRHIVIKMVKWKDRDDLKLLEKKTLKYMGNHISIARDISYIYIYTHLYIVIKSRITYSKYLMKKKPTWNSRKLSCKAIIQIWGRDKKLYRQNLAAFATTKTILQELLKGHI